ncbi:MAG: hypothetical protein ABSF22_02070 [Bryobacteraceae bacterium]
MKLFFSLFFVPVMFGQAVTTAEKAAYLERDLIDKHLLEGLYVSMVPVAPEGTKLPHTVDDPGNVIHAGVWTGRYLAGVAYEYAVTQDPQVRKLGGQLLIGLRRLQEVTGKPGLLARGYIKGHGPVEGFERGGGDSAHWHQGQGAFADYRFYSDVSVDNFNAVLYGYALYFDLAADAEQKKMIAYDVDRLMTHMLDNHYRVIDLNGKVTQYGHIGVDPDPARDEYYFKGGDSELKRYITGTEWHPGLRVALMALPDLLIAYHVTGKARYIDEYRKVIARFAANPEPARDTRPFSLERIAKANHSSEGQAYEALFNLIRYENDPKLLTIYDQWVSDLWDLNWMEGNPLYTFMTVALIPEKWEPAKPADWKKLAHADESMQLSIETLRRYPVDRVMHPVMNSIRTDIEISPFEDRAHEKQAAKPVPIDQRPLDNEYAWKGNPYALDGWLKPTVTSLQFACDDPLVAWFSDANGRAYMTRDGMKTWTQVSFGLLGAHVKRLAASPTRTFVVWAETDRGVVITRDGGMSWRAPAVDDLATGENKPAFEAHDAHAAGLRIDEKKRLLRKAGDGSETPSMEGWRIPVATWVIVNARGTYAGGPGGAYSLVDGKWREVKLWAEEETGPADYLHAYWMGRYYGFYK